jgi:hypothetical protein
MGAVLVVHEVLEGGALASEGCRGGVCVCSSAMHRH